MKSQDIIILLKLLSLEEQEKLGILGSSHGSSGNGDPHAVRNLESSLGISKSEVSASLGRSQNAGLATKVRGRVTPNRRNLAEFILHGLKYVFPAKAGTLQRGIPTAFAAPMLKGQLLSAGEDIYVWPHADGHERGLSIEPLFKSVPEAAQKDERLYEYLALVDAVRLGNQREAGLARERLEQKVLDR